MEKRIEVKEAFLSVDKDNDCRITFAQMKKLFATLYLKKGHHSSFRSRPSIFLPGYEGAMEISIFNISFI
jgi:hypothetical protein